MAFGGAGALHAAALSTRLDMESVIVPNHAGVFSAVGLLLSPIRIDVIVPSLDLDPAAVDVLADAAVVEARAAFVEAVGSEPETVELAALTRYAGQSHELSVAIERRRRRHRASSSPTRLRGRLRDAIGVSTPASGSSRWRYTFAPGTNPARRSQDRL